MYSKLFFKHKGTKDPARILVFFSLGLLCLCVLVTFFSARPAHDFHASVTQIQFDAKEQAFEISIRVFTDDFEKALSAATSSKVSLTNSPGPASDKNDPVIEKYVQSHFAYMTPQKQLKPFKYIGHETEVDANWLYLEIPYTEPFRGGLLKQSMLTELFDDQVNMVNVQYQGQKKTFVFRKNQPIQDISLNK